MGEQPRQGGRHRSRPPAQESQAARRRPWTWRSGDRHRRSGGIHGRQQQLVHHDHRESECLAGVVDHGATVRRREALRRFERSVAAGAPDVPVKVGPPPTALVSEDLKVGDGAAVTAANTLSVNYIGVSCSTGKIFDSSYSRGQPASFPLSNVIQGWQQGLPGMKVGGQRLLGIPPAMAYGSNPPSDRARRDAVVRRRRAQRDVASPTSRWAVSLKRRRIHRWGVITSCEMPVLSDVNANRSNPWPARASRR